MRKMLAVIKREYIQRVRTKFFIIITVLGPVMLIVFTIVPGLLFRIKAGGDTRLAVVDQTEGMKLYDSIRRSLVEEHPHQRRSSSVSESLDVDTEERAKEAGKSMKGGFQVQPVNPSGQPLAKIKQELNQKIGGGELDGYLVVPPEILQNSEIKTAYYGRNIGDVITRGQIEDGLDRAVRRERLIANGVREEQIAQLSEPVEVVTFPVNEKGEEGVEDSGAGFAMVFVIAFLIYITVLLYGQVVLGAIVEEKETRVAEVLLSSVKSSTLMVGKLIGVSLVAFTQMGLWALAFALMSVFGVAFLASQGVDMGNFHLPHLPAAFFLCFFLFFALGYFLFASLYVLIGSMVTSAQEGGQLAVPVVFVLITGLYLAFPVIRSPNSSFAVWVSMVPFFSPITMVVRIVSQTPPVWQILLSLFVGALNIVFLLWISSRIYRIGMLMYGKRATIPEVIRWARQL